MKTGAILCMVLTITALTLEVAISQERELISGLSMEEVKDRWGEPLERVEQESRRTDVWSYPAGKVVFLEGRLTKFPTSETTAHGGTASTKGAALAHSAPIPPEVNADLGTDDFREEQGTDVIADVLRAIPADAGEKTGPPTLQRPIVPNRPNPSALVQPIPGGAVAADLEESEELEEP